MVVSSSGFLLKVGFTGVALLQLVSCSDVSLVLSLRVFALLS